MKARAGGNPYLGEVAACDEAVGRMLAALREERLLDSTLVLVVSDHGEAFDEHGEVSHGPFVWNTTLRVPLILRHPGGDHGGTRVSAVASVVDVFPTALEAMGLAGAREERIDGVSLYRDEPGPERGAYFESYYGYLNFGWHPLSGWVDGAGKYVHAPRALFFEPAQDPKEEHDLLAQRESRAAAFRGALSELSGGSVLARDAEGLDPELKRSLQALGYAAYADEGRDFPAPLAALALPDPHERTRELADFQRAQGLIHAGQHTEAELALRALLEQHPGNHFAWDRLALCLMRLNRHREALAPLERVLAESPGNADTWNYLGACRLVVGEEEKALAAFTRALELDPNHVQALGGLVHLMEAAGMGAQAAPFKRRFEAVQSRP
jgi:tetratricopeptide (TPR) repeat protein